ncbi:beta-ketoacyl-ACP reductase [Brevibacillus ginsengisoli]|uniref:beta-ketoacyl-ACP reductase n=1 Tax=Brevibacillus ginsengisoli TaxID=363854 RepID=UPI003CE6B352
MRLKDRVVIITGGASGIGRTTSLLFAEEGAQVVVADYQEATGKETVAKIIGQGGQARFEQVDVSNRSSVERMVQSVLVAYGHIDVLINNAGITADATLTKMKEEQWDRVIAINLTGVFTCTQLVVPHMIERGSGRIISTSSIVGIHGNFGQTNYAATKGGIIAMTKTWAKELGPKGITCNAVAPGFIATPMTKAVPEKILNMMEERVPLRKLGDPLDVANAYLYLASDAGRYVNGAVLSIDGGLSL